MTDQEKLICSICSKPIDETNSVWLGGNNAEPINAGRCCDVCDRRLVIPARIERMRKAAQ